MTVFAPHRSMTLPQLQLVTAGVIALVNLAGVATTAVMLVLVVPLPSVAYDDNVQVNNIWLGLGNMLIGGFIGVSVGLRYGREATAWWVDEREPTNAEKIALLGLPRRLFKVAFALWCAAAFAEFMFNETYSLGLGTLAGVIVVMAGIITSTITYLIAERFSRPVARQALATGVPEAIGMRLGVRVFLSWLLGSGVLLLGMALSGLTALTLGDTISTERISITVLVLGLTAFAVGGFMIFMAAKATSDPVRALRASVARVQAGDLNADVPIYDGTELGVLQAGFNNMLVGLREREEIRDLFGRHVGPDVARAALHGGVKLGGEVRRVGVLFVDIVGSTSMASNRAPEEVVSVLNRFFDIVIEVVDRNGGWINKFEGDAALAIWGAPTEQWGVATDILRAARELGQRLRLEMPEIQAGIGISLGKAVAGNVGAARRYEYTVIGDAVNEAARLSELAKTYEGMVLARATIVDEAADQGVPGTDEVAHWKQLPPITLRGRAEDTPIAVPTA